MLSKGSRRLFEWLRQQNAGTIVSFDEIKAIAQWSESSLTTYIKKNKLAAFLTVIEGHRLKVVLDGDKLTEQYFDETFTQKAPRPVNLSQGEALSGSKKTYTLEQPIGEGAIGHVWIVKADDDPNQRFAAKVMMPRPSLLQVARMPDIRERFRREAEYGAKLSHQNVVHYVDLGQKEKNPFLVMELAERSLADRLHYDGRVQEEEAAEILVCCIDGLKFIHGRGHIHRDVKPANILEFPSTYKLGDLGVVKWSDFDPIVTRGGTITKESTQLGSWHYISPEQLNSAHDAGPEADVYSLGVTWIEILNGTVPGPHEVAGQVYSLPDVAQPIRDLIAKMCAIDASRRPNLEEVKTAVLDVYG